MKKMLMSVFLLLCSLAAGFGQETRLVIQSTHTGMPASIGALAVSQYDEYLVTGGLDQTIKVYNLTTNTLLRTLTGHAGMVDALAFADGERMLVSGDETGLLMVWDLESGRLLKRVELPDPINCVIYDDGVAYIGGGDTGSQDGYVWACDLDSGDISYTTSVLGPVRTLIFPAQESYLLAGTGAAANMMGEEVFGLSSIYRIRRDTGDVIEELSIPEEDGRKPIMELVPVSDGEFCSVNMDGFVRLWTTEPESSRRIGQGPEWPDSAKLILERYLTVTNGSEYFIYDLTTDELTYSGELDIPERRFPGKRTVLANTALVSYVSEQVSGRLIRADLETRTWVQPVRLPHLSFATDFVFTPDGSGLIAAYQDGTVKLFDLETFSLTYSLQMYACRTGSQFRSVLAMNPSGTLMAVSQEEGSIGFYDPRTFQEVDWMIVDEYGTTPASSLGFLDEDLLYTFAEEDFFDDPYFVLYDTEAGRATYAAERLSLGLQEIDGGRHLFFGYTPFTTRSQEPRKVVPVSGIGNTESLESLSPTGQIDVGSGRYYATTTSDQLWVVEKHSGRSVQYPRREGLVSSLAISPDDGTCALGYANGDLVLIDTTSGREITRTGGDNQAIFKVAFSPDSRYCVAAYDAGSIRVLNTENLEAVNILSLDEQWLVYTDDGYFDCSANGFQMVGITRGLDSLSLDQEAVYRNRPDLILERMGAGGEPLQQFFRRKYLYRLALMEPFSTPLPRRLSDDILMQLTDDERATLPSTQEWRNGEADWSSLSVLQQHSLLQNRQVHDALVAYLTNDVRLPGIHVEDIIRLDDGVTATLRMEGGSFPIDRCQVEVNNVAILGELGREIVEPVVSITVPLSSGDNRVEFSCVDTAGLESAKVVRNFHSDETRTGDLIFIGFGVSDYEDDSLDLKYAAKDVADMRDTFDLMSHEYYSTVRSYGFYDSQVNAATMEQAREILSQTRVEDTVVMMVAGHGIQLVEGTPEYFFVPAAANLNDIRATGFPFTDFEQLLDGIPARTRVMLIDTCESGVADEETLHLVSSRVPTGAQARGLRVIQAESTAMPFRYTGTRNRYIFRNILQVNGSIVMSSSRANQFSYESDLIQNGFFTQGILLALGRIGEEVDLDSLTPEQRAAWDRVFADIAGYSKNELITQVSNWVQGQTGELQSPGIDRDNPDIDVTIPVVW